MQQLKMRPPLRTNAGDGFSRRGHFGRELFLALGHPPRPRGDSRVSQSRLAIQAFWAEKNLTETSQRVFDLMLPRVILHNAVSLDGRIDGFPVDLQQYYALAATWKEDATLAGSGTFLKAVEEAPPEDESAFIQPNVNPGDQRAILVIPDSRGRIRTWHYLRSLPYWRHFVALCSKSTPQDYLDYLKDRHIDCIIAGDDHVDLRTALEELHSRYAVRVVRVDAGGTLNGLLLRQGLVSEVSVLIYPSLVGGEATSRIFRAPDLTAAVLSADDADIASGKGAEGTISLQLMQAERLSGDVMWLRYEVRQKDSDGHEVCRE